MLSDKPSTAPTQPSARGLLDLLTKARLVEVGRDFGVAVPSSATKEVQVERMAASGRIGFSDLLRSLSRDELRAACRAHGLDDSSRSRPELVARLLAAHTDEAPAAVFGRDTGPRFTPRAGDIVQVRLRQYLVEEVFEPTAPGELTRAVLACLDDDAQGRRLEVLWELELGARVLQPERHLPRSLERLDPPRSFAAYLNALRWNAVTATDARLFQSPFRAGIQLLDHQLTPLKKALELPRANLFIADDVGLGKTIEAGLVLQELILRQRVDFVLVVCPAALCLQWRDEMERRFGLRFEIYNRDFVGRRRQERGFGVNPWATHHRFIISYQTLRRAEHREPLLVRLGERVPKSLLILDEAHTAAPASASRYAVDSETTGMVREMAPRFENRLFLSATPHNGHSNSFSALLEILDPQRFTRGVGTLPGDLEPVMVRRLKTDLRELGRGSFPERKVVRIDLDPDGAEPAELVLSRLLAEYTELMQPRRGKRGRLVFINLQKRLLSSIEAFFRTLELHAASVGSEEGGHEESAGQALLSLDAGEGDEYGPTDEEAEALEAAGVAATSRRLRTPEGRARQLLDEMLRLARAHRDAPDAKVETLVDWIRRHQCPAVRIGGAAGPAADRQWTDRRVIVFTEYADTKRYLRRLLTAAFDGTRQGEERILEFHGGLSDERRDEIQRAWNAPSAEHPVRVLLATDAAREGVNLQGACADLFHFDIPWNPARLEQRNGRIDRALQPEPEVRCHYFVYSRRQEDRVLDILVEKVDRIRRELGSLSAVLLERFEKVMEEGIGEATAARLEEEESLGGRKEVVRGELESERADRRRLVRDIEEAGRILNESRAILAFDRDLLREVVDVGLELADAGRLAPAAPDPRDPGMEVWTLPELPASWRETLDTLRPPRRRTESWDEWRRRPPLPVVFQPLLRLGDERVHLHLQHPLVQRILSRFLAQGYAAHDLARVTVLRDTTDALPRVLVFGRLSLFGPGAARLHDELVGITVRWLDSGGPGHLEPLADADGHGALALLDRLLREPAVMSADGDPFGGIAPRVRDRLRAVAVADFAALWEHVEREANTRAHAAEHLLAARGEKEAADLRRLLEAQRAAIGKTLAGRSQMPLDFGEMEKDQRDQYERDKRHMEGRLGALEREIETEPAQLRALYRVVRPRLEPVGMVYLWPEVRG